MTVIAANPVRLRLTPNVRRAVLTVHIVASVGLLGDSAGFVAVALRGATTDDPALAASCYELLDMFSLVFGIPLSFTSLITGILLGVSSRYGVLRHGWTAAKLVLIASVILVGAFVIGPANARMLDGTGGSEYTLVAASAYDVLALLLATGLTVYKPRRRSAAREHSASVGTSASRRYPSPAGPK
jgi:uncharacterized membrane protein